MSNITFQTEAKLIRIIEFCLHRYNIPFNRTWKDCTFYDAHLRKSMFYYNVGHGETQMKFFSS